MPLPELMLNTPTPGTREAYTTLEAELQTGELSMKWTAAPPAALRGVGAAGVGGQFTVIIGSEIILCEAGESKTVVILERKAEGSIEANHASGSSIFVVPTAESIKRSSGTLVEVITSTKKWKKPKGASFVTVYVIGGGGGGGGGGHDKNAVAGGGGGGGGGGGALSVYTFPAAALPLEVEATVGKGGKGGNGTETEKANGEAGKIGEPSHFGEYLYAGGGSAGVAGKEASEATSSNGGTGLYSGNKSGTGSKESAGGEPIAPTGGGAAGGGGGGGVTTASGTAGGKGGYSLLGSEVRAEGGKSGSTTEAGGEGKEGEAGLAESGLPGRGGGGGGSSFLSTGGKGGKGGKYGGGGGGGGGSTALTKSSGEGGAGGEGVIVIITEF